MATGDENNLSNAQSEDILPPIVLATPSLDGYWPDALQKAGVKVHIVDDVEGLAERVEIYPPPVLLIDLKIDKSGLAAIRDILILKSMDTSIFLVALGDVENKEVDESDKIIDFAFELGAQDFLEKGLATDKLSQRIRFIYRHAVYLQRLRSTDRGVLDKLREGGAHWLWDMEKDLVYVSSGMRFLMKAPSEARLIPLEQFLSYFSAQQRKGFERAITQVKDKGDPARLFQIFSAGPLKGAVEHVLVREQYGKNQSRIKGVGRLREDQEKHRQKLFSRDRMTGLPNQDGMLVALENVLAMQTKKDDQFESGFVGLIAVDIDRFKRIAAVYGREASDEAVKEIAKRLKTFIVEPDAKAVEAARRGDKTLLAKSKAVYLSCLGRDEFAFLITGLDRVDASAQLAGKLVKAFNEPFSIDGNDIFLSVSIGVTISPVDGDNAEDLLKHARTALAKAKNQPTSGYQFYSPALASSEKERLEMESLLRQVIDEKKLTMKYQPQVDIKSGKIIGVEALVRWDHPEFGAMSPAAFISIAEEVGIISDLGDWVMRESIKDAQYWNANGDKLQLSVNISTGMFTSGNLHKKVEKILKESEFDPSQLTLEVTEGVIMQDMEVAVSIMNKLKKRGVKMALDDFGTGYSSLSYLKSLPFDIIKIDRSFVGDMMDHPNGAAMIRAIMDISKSLNIDVVAEGVEMETQLEMLTKEGVGHYQGYLCSGPVDREAILELTKVQY